MEPLLKQAGDAMRGVINEKLRTYRDIHAHHQAALESDTAWKRLDQGQRAAFLVASGVRSPAPLDLSSPEAVLARLTERPLDAWSATIDALPGRFQSARQAALKQLELEPAVIPLALPNRVIRTEAELDAWLAEVRLKVRSSWGRGLSRFSWVCLTDRAFNRTLYSTEDSMIAQLTANDLKTKGVNVIDELSRESDGIIITVRGKDKYVILPIAEYNQLREYELDAAIREARADVEAGRYHSGTVEEHLERIRNV